MDSHNIRLGSPIAANRSLIGDDHQCSTDPLSSGPSFQREVDRLEVTRLDDVAVDDTPIQNSIAVQEQSRSRHRTSFTAYVTEHCSEGRGVCGPDSVPHSPYLCWGPPSRWESVVVLAVGLVVTRAWWRWGRGPRVKVERPQRSKDERP
jgi:hypothetical protein